MENKGKIQEKDIVDKKVYEIGSEIEKSLKPASTEIERLKNNWVGAMDDMKKSIFELDKLQKGFKTAKGYKEIIDLKEKQAIAFEKSNKAIKDEKTAMEQIQIAYKEQQRLEKNLITTIERKKLATEGTNRALIKEREELRLTNLETKRSLTSMGLLISKRDAARKSVQEYQAKLQLGKNLSDQEQRELKQSTKEYEKYDKAVKIVKNSTGEFQENVSNYPKQLSIATSAFKKLIPIIGALGGLKLAFNFAKEARQLAIEAKGVEFAFQRIEERTGDAEAALLRAKESTRGLLSDLDIKKAIVELDNFNISTQETDTLLEFLAVRAAQTGESIDNLKSSLVEGLSKESKLRIDNLGISAAELNKELERTPNFVEAVANIAKKEIAEAGNILEEAENSQAKWNAALKDFQLEIGKGFIAKASNSLYSLGTNVLRLITPTKELTNATKQEQAQLNTLVTSILKTNEQDENRKELLNELSEKYPVFLKFIKDENMSNDSLKKSLAEVNALYIKRLALQRTVEKLDLAGKQAKLADETADLAKITGDYQSKLTELNLWLNRGTLDTDLATKSLEEQNKSLKESFEYNENRLVQLRAQGKATQGQINDIAKYRVKLNELASATRVFSSANSQFGFAQNAVNDVTREVEKLEKQLGITKEEMDDLFNGDNEVVITFDSKEFEEREKTIMKRMKQLAEDKYNYNKAVLESEMQANKRILDSEENTLSEKQLANIRYYDAKQKLLQIQRDKELDESKGRADKLAEIQLKYNDETLDLEKQREENALKLLKDHFNQELKLVQEAEQAKKAAQNIEIGQAQATFQNEVDANPNDLNAQLAAKEKYENTVLEIEKKYALLSIQVQIDKINAINRANLTVEDIAQLEKQKADLEIAYSNIATAQKLDDIEKEKEAQEKLVEEIAKVKEKLFTDISKGLGDALNIDTSAINDLFNSVDSGISKLNDGLETTKFGVSDVLQTLSAASEVTRDIISSVYQANIEYLESQLDAMNEYYDAAFERAEGDKIQQDLIREEQRLKEQELKKQIAKEKTKAAEADKKAAIIQAGINTALAITSALTQTPPLSYVMAALSAAMGLAQIAIIASKPIPKFKDGHLLGTYEGWAITNDGGRDEVWERDGKAKVIKGRNVPIHMKKGDKIHRSVEDYKGLMRASVLEGIETDNRKLKAYQSEQTQGNKIDEKAIEKAISNGFKNQKVNFHTTNNTKVNIGHEIWRLKQLE